MPTKRGRAVQGNARPYFILLTQNKGQYEPPGNVDCEPSTAVSGRIQASALGVDPVVSEPSPSRSEWVMAGAASWRRGLIYQEASMSLVSDSRKYAQDWFDLAQHLPLKHRQVALEIAGAWFQLAMDAAALDARATGASAVNSRSVH